MLYHFMGPAVCHVIGNFQGMYERPSTAETLQTIR
jgi:hypothetical protein